MGLLKAHIWRFIENFLLYLVAGSQEEASIDESEVGYGAALQRRWLAGDCHRWIFPGLAGGAMNTKNRSIEAQSAGSVTQVAEANLPTPFAEFRMRVYRAVDGKEHLALFLGSPSETDAPLVRVHSECLTGDALFSLRCDCGAQLQAALEKVAAAREGVVVYLRQEGRGIGLGNKIRAYSLQDKGDDTVEANRKLGFPDDGRDYLPAVEILRDLGVSRLRLMTNNPRKLHAMTRYGLDVRERVPLVAGVNPYNQRYLDVKAAKLGHLINLP